MVAVTTLVSLCILRWLGHMKHLLHFPSLTLWLHHKVAKAQNISWSLFKADNELFVLLLEFHHIKVLLIKMNKIIHVAQMSQCCLITNFPIKIKLGHLHWNIKNWYGRNSFKCLRTVLNILLSVETQCCTHSTRLLPTYTSQGLFSFYPS